MRVLFFMFFLGDVGLWGFFLMLLLFSLLPFLSPLKNFFSGIWLLCNIIFCCIAKSCSYTYIYILFHIGLSQDSEYSSLCYEVPPCFLSIRYKFASILYIIPTSQSILSLPPTWQSQVCSLCLWVYFCFVNKFSCLIF